MFLYTGKGKQDSNEELLQYLEREDERFLQHSKVMNDALLYKMKADTSLVSWAAGRMVAVRGSLLQLTALEPHGTVLHIWCI